MPAAFGLYSLTVCLCVCVCSPFTAWMRVHLFRMHRKLLFLRSATGHTHILACICKPFLTMCDNHMHMLHVWTVRHIFIHAHTHTTYGIMIFRNGYGEERMKKWRREKSGMNIVWPYRSIHTEIKSEYEFIHGFSLIRVQRTTVSRPFPNAFTMLI